MCRSYLANLVYSFSYSHHPQSKEVSILGKNLSSRLSQLTGVVCQKMAKYSPLELSVILRAYVELGVMNRDLDRGLVKYVQKR